MRFGRVHQNDGFSRLSRKTEFCTQWFGFEFVKGRSLASFCSAIELHPKTQTLVFWILVSCRSH